MPYILGLKNDVFQSQFKNILGNSTFCWIVVYGTPLAQHAVYLYGISKIMICKWIVVHLLSQNPDIPDLKFTTNTATKGIKYTHMIKLQDKRIQPQFFGDRLDKK